MGELLDVAWPSGPGGSRAPSHGGLALVAEGSNPTACAKVWTLEPPHRWGHEGSEWQLVQEFQLSTPSSSILPVPGPAVGEEVPAKRTLRLRGIALWKSNQGHRFHAAIAEEAPSKGVFFGQSAKVELFHHSFPLAFEAAVTVEESIGSPLPTPVAAKAPQMAPEAVVQELSGIRQELRGLREGFEAFRGDFIRLVQVMETLVDKASPVSLLGSP